MNIFAYSYGNLAILEILPKDARLKIDIKNKKQNNSY